MIQTDTNTETTENPQRKAGAIRGNQYALRHGLFAKQDLIEGEDTNEYMEFIARVLNEEQVIGAVETQLAARIGGLLWRMGRVSRLEAEVWDRIFKIEERVHQLNLLAHYDARLGRELARTRVELEKTKALRTQRPVESVPVGPLTERATVYREDDPRTPITLIIERDDGGKSIICNGNLKEVGPDGTIEYDGLVVDAPGGYNEKMKAAEAAEKERERQ